MWTSACTKNARINREPVGQTADTATESMRSTGGGGRGNDVVLLSHCEIVIHYEQRISASETLSTTLRNGKCFLISCK